MPRPFNIIVRSSLHKVSKTLEQALCASSKYSGNGLILKAYGTYPYVQKKKSEQELLAFLSAIFLALRNLGYNFHFQKILLAGLLVVFCLLFFKVLLDCYYLPNIYSQIFTSHRAMYCIEKLQLFQT